jgi:predicted phosphodiesterase
MLIIGDVHGKVDKYWKILQKHKGESIQAGDFGFKKEHEWHLKNIDNSRSKICFGNHDDYTYLNKPHSCGNYSYRDELGLMTVRGAYSIDRAIRTEGRDWWREEEMTYKAMLEIYDFYAKTLPNIVISHDCPNIARIELFDCFDKSSTSNLLQSLYNAHEPSLWVFGHWHKSVDKVIGKTRFVCLNELETFLI